MAVKVRLTLDGGTHWLDPAEHPKPIEGAECYVKIDWKGTRKAKKIGLDSKATRKLAEQAAEQITAKLTLDGVAALAPEPTKDRGPAAPLLKHVATEWLEWHQAHRPRRESTQENYRSVLDVHLIPMLGDRRITAIDRAVVQEFVAALRKKVAYITITNRYLPVLRKIMAFAVDERHYLQVNPFSGSRLFEPSDADREAAPQPQPFTGKELVAIIGAAEKVSPQFALFVRFWSQLGARSGEVRALRVRDLDLKAGTVNIESTLVEKHGKSIHGHTKNHWKGGKRRASFLHAIATDQPADRILKHLARHVKDKQPGDYVFTRPSDGGPITEGSLGEAWRRATDLSGVEYYRSAEQLRHTNVSARIERGENVLSVSADTGHSPATIWGSYAKKAEEKAARKQHARGRLRAV